MDCLSLDSVRKFAVDWEARGLPLDVLINFSGTSCVAGLYLLFFATIVSFDYCPT